MKLGRDAVKRRRKIRNVALFPWQPRRHSTSHLAFGEVVRQIVYTSNVVGLPAHNPRQSRTQFPGLEH